MKNLYCKWLSKVSEASIQYNRINRAIPAPRKPPASLHHAVGSHLFTGNAETSSIPPVEQHIPQISGLLPFHTWALQRVYTAQGYWHCWIEVATTDTSQRLRSGPGSCFFKVQISGIFSPTEWSLLAGSRWPHLDRNKEDSTNWEASKKRGSDLDFTVQKQQKFRT